MHEMSIAQSLLESVLSAAAEANAVRVNTVEIEVGAMQLVVPEALQAAWEAVRAGSLADGADLKIDEILAEAECRPCGWRFKPDIAYSFLCPKCKQADAKIIRGNEILLKSMVCETEDE